MRFLIFNPDNLLLLIGEKDQSSSAIYLALIQGVCLSRKSNFICIAWLLKYCLPQGVSHSPQMQHARATLKPSRPSRKSWYTSWLIVCVCFCLSGCVWFLSKSTSSSLKGFWIRTYNRPGRCKAFCCDFKYLEKKITCSGNILCFRWRSVN